jgi:hypothetical protein
MEGGQGDIGRHTGSGLMGAPSDAAECARTLCESCDASASNSLGVRSRGDSPPNFSPSRMGACSGRTSSGSVYFSRTSLMQWSDMYGTSKSYTSVSSSGMVQKWISVCPFLLPGVPVAELWMSIRTFNINSESPDPFAHCVPGR